VLVSSVSRFLVVAGVIGIAIGTLAELVLERKTTAREQV